MITLSKSTPSVTLLKQCSLTSVTPSLHHVLSARRWRPSREARPGIIRALADRHPPDHPRMPQAHFEHVGQDQHGHVAAHAIAWPGDALQPAIGPPYCSPVCSPPTCSLTTRANTRPRSASSRVFASRRPNKSRRGATRAVQPVWWLAPSPAPLSPWKYS